MGVAFAVLASRASADLGESRTVRAPAEPIGPTHEEPARREPPALLPRVAIARAAGWVFAPEPAASDREEESEAALEEGLDDARDRDRTDAIGVDGWYAEAGRAMRQRFRPDRDQVEAERRGGMSLLQVAFDELRRHAAPRERPMDVPGQTPPNLRAAVTDPTDRAQAVEQERWDWCNALNSPVTWYRADVRMTHNPEGDVSAAWVLRSSGIRALDEAAVQSAREGAMSMPAPPENVVGDRQAIQSDWAFELGDVATPIACATSSGATADMMCVDDPIQGTRCAILGRGIVRTRVRLLRVLDAEHPSAAERRAARRADPDRPRP